MTGVIVVGTKGGDAHLAVLGNVPKLRRMLTHVELDVCSGLSVLKLRAGL